MPEPTIKELAESDEGQTVEHKASLAEDVAAIETLSAFANADGGYVVIGVSPSRKVTGVSIGANSLERLANEVREHTSPTLYPRLEVRELDGRELVTLYVGPSEEVVYAYNKAFVRVGRTNQPMDATEQRRRHRAGVADKANLPEFHVQHIATDRMENQFHPQFTVEHAKGEVVSDMQWRVRGPRYSDPESTEWGTMPRVCGSVKLTSERLRTFRSHGSKTPWSQRTN